MIRAIKWRRNKRFVLNIRPNSYEPIIATRGRGVVTRSRAHLNPRRVDEAAASHSQDLAQLRVSSDHNRAVGREAQLISEQPGACGIAVSTPSASGSSESTASESTSCESTASESTASESISSKCTSSGSSSSGSASSESTPSASAELLGAVSSHPSQLTWPVGADRRLFGTLVSCHVAKVVFLNDDCVTVNVWKYRRFDAAVPCPGDDDSSMNMTVLVPMPKGHQMHRNIVCIAILGITLRTGG